MAYYAEYRGKRLPLTDMQYEAFVRLHGWYHIIRDTHITIIGKRGM